jgi:hypothetical protein
VASSWRQVRKATMNYCRQALLQWRSDPAAPAVLRPLGELLSMAHKFLLPPGGVLLEDGDLKAVDETLPLRLPFPVIALEYSFGPGLGVRVGEQTYDAWITVAQEAVEGGVVFWSAARVVDSRVWSVSEMTSLSAHNYLLRTAEEVCLVFEPGQVVDDRAAADARVLLHLQNALACSNVAIERKEPKHAGRAIKSALPFDAYHVLTVGSMRGDAAASSAGGGHRSPREHLRRGHIRRLADGRRVFVSATVVAAGRGAGVVSKDYRLKRP